MSLKFVRLCGALVLLGGVVATAVSGAAEVNLTPDKAYIEVVHGNKLIRLQRIQDTEHELTGGWTKTSRKCPPFCIQAMSAGEGVHTIGQLEMFNFMESQLRQGTGLIIDARTPAWNKRGTIPGSINIPFKVFGQDPDNPELLDALERLGVKPRDDDAGTLKLALEKWGFFGGGQKNEFWDFSAAKDIVLWCNGPWCGQSPRAINNLLKLGYPAEKIYYYRGGMQIWKILGLTTAEPISDGGAN
ncbi:MAG: rhodanese-like domain-containing protein [Chromatiales bacterium]|nr:rhodanese-like domain-containing protein [Chromatiales bacterium]